MGDWSWKEWTAFGVFTYVGLAVAMVTAQGLTIPTETKSGPFHQVCGWWLTPPDGAQGVTILSMGAPLESLREPSVYESILEKRFNMDFNVVGIDPITTPNDLLLLGHWRMDQIFVAFGSQTYTDHWTGQPLTGQACGNVAYVQVVDCPTVMMVHEVSHILNVDEGRESNGHIHVVPCGVNE